MTKDLKNQNSPAGESNTSAELGDETPAQLKIYELEHFLKEAFCVERCRFVGFGKLKNDNSPFSFRAMIFALKDEKRGEFNVTLSKRIEI